MTTDAGVTDLVGVRDAARALGLNASTISRYLKDFPALNLGSKTRPKVDVDVLRRHRAENTNPARRGSYAGKLLGESAGNGKGDNNGDGPNYAASKAEREWLLAQRARIELDARRGLLVPCAEVEAAVYDAGTVLQRDLLEIPAQLAERLAAMDEPHAIAELLEGEFRRVLAALAASLRADAAAEEERKANATAEVVTLEPRPCP